MHCRTIVKNIFPLPPPPCSPHYPDGASTGGTRTIDVGPLTPAGEGKESGLGQGKLTTTTQQNHTHTDYEQPPLYNYITVRLY